MSVGRCIAVWLMLTVASWAIVILAAMIVLDLVR